MASSPNEQKSLTNMVGKTLVLYSSIMCLLLLGLAGYLLDRAQKTFTDAKDAEYALIVEKLSNSLIAPLVEGDADKVRQTVGEARNGDKDIGVSVLDANGETIYSDKADINTTDISKTIDIWNKKTRIGQLSVFIIPEEVAFLPVNWVITGALYLILGVGFCVLLYILRNIKLYSAKAQFVNPQNETINSDQPIKTYTVSSDGKLKKARLLDNVQPKIAETPLEERRTIKAELDVNVGELILTIIKHLPCAMIVESMDRSKKILNYKFTEITGYQPEDFIRMNAWDIIHPDNRDEFKESINALKEKTGQSKRIDIQIKKQDETFIDVTLCCFVGVREIFLEPMIIMQFEEQSEISLLSDVSENKDIESSYKALFDTQAIAMGVSNADGLLTTVNQAYCDLFGYSEEELVGKINVRELAHESNSHQTVSYYKALKEKRFVHFHVEKRFVRKTGEIIDCNVHICGLYNQAGEFTGTATSIANVTEQKFFDRKLKESEQRYKSIFENQVIGICISDSKGLLQQVNPAMCELLEYSQEEIVGNLRIKDITHPKDLEESETKFDGLKSGENQSCVMEKSYITKNGRIAHCWIHKNALLDESGEFQGVSISAVDITEKKNAEERLKNSESEYRNLFENQAVAIVVADHSGKIIRANAAFCRMFGYSEEFLQNRRFILDLAYDDGGQYYEDLKVRLEDKNNQESGVESKFLTADGSLLEAELFINHSDIDQNDGGKCTVSFVDITERKRIEKLKNDFISTVSHELQTPLTAIHGALGLVSEIGEDCDPGTIQQMVDMALRNSKRLKLLISDLLDIGKLENGGLKFELETQSINELLKQAVETNSTYALEYNTKIELQKLPEDVMVQVDANRLQQVLANLISNAAKYSPADSVVNVRGMCQEEKLIISVSDQGEGIPKSFRNKIFDKFAQAEPHESRKPGSTGLGLYIAKSIVERLGGSMWFETEDSKGTTFFFDLPLIQSAVNPKVKTSRTRKIALKPTAKAS